MRAKITSESSATVNLTAREADCLRAFGVPMIYGGMGPELDGTHAGAMTVRFGGPAFVNARERLDEGLALFKAAMTAEIARQDAQLQAAQDEDAGFNAFPSSSFRRGHPAWPRCPFRQPDRVVAWQRGLDAAHTEMLRAGVFRRRAHDGDTNSIRGRV